ncbi:CASP-like protein UU5 [Physcomitrium patens]|uniref:CASP-like protein UU5 n=2 Tax=Physcomitrium patens TaxID=3218 RepID=CSPLA_PHYPA|nr:CASP-like protein UU5 [Physcomitrium patens]A9S1T8.1 RecName: Full=CASP-like protein UU5; Short=PpCASPLUU5 [Physcomitrium patens]PNR50982.1 hypothetical protein PHYPA_010168 [Physcomitrium patens]|eukprot:XP_024381122.1 CASP-like protein UU5 [Physcomitrella patens]
MSTVAQDSAPGGGKIQDAMEQGAPGASSAAVVPEGGHYTQTPSPAFQAVKKNINHMSAFSLGLRVAEFVLSVIAFSLMASADQNGAVYSTFTSYSFVLAVNVLVVFYTIGQIIMSVLLLVSGSTPKKIYLFITFGCDQLSAFLLMAAGAAGASVALIINRGGVTDAYGNGCIDGKITSFCSHAQASVAFTFLSFFCMVISSLLGVYSLAPYLIL